MKTIEAFKRAFQKKFGSAQKNYDIRRTKVTEALDELATAVGKLESTNHVEAGTYRTALVRLRGRALDADKQAKFDANAAFSALDPIKQDARDQARAATDLADESEAAARKRAKKTAMDVTLEDGSKAKVFPNDIPGFDKLDDNAKQTMLETVARKISNGQRLLQDILDKDPKDLKDPTPKDVTDFVWLLKSKAQETIGEPYERGAMTIPDKGNKIRAYLDRCPEVYGRDSSHFLEQQGKSGQQARGMDFYEGVDEESGQIGDPDRLLPCGMRALLIQQLTMPGGKSEDKERLYIKMETESARYNPSFKATDSTLPPSRPLRDGDKWNAVLHLGNLLKSNLGLSQGEDPDLKKFKEEGVKDVTKKLKATLDYLKKKNPDAYRVLSPALSPSKLFVKSSVRVNEMLAGIERLSGMKTIEIDAEAMKLIGAAFDALANSYDLSGKDITVRAGGEVALFMDDLTGKKKQDIPEEDILGRIEEELAALEECERIEDLDQLRVALTGAREALGDVRDLEVSRTSKRIQSSLRLFESKISDLATEVSRIEDEEADTIDNDQKQIGKWMRENGMADHAKRFLGILQRQVDPDQLTIEIGVLRAARREIMLEENTQAKVLNRFALQIKAVEACQHTDKLEELQKVHTQSTELITTVRRTESLRGNKVVESTARQLENKLAPLGRLIKSLEGALVSA